MPVRQLVFYLIALVFSTSVYAADSEDESPESDIGLSAESVPVKNEFKLNDLVFTPVEGKPVIDGDISDTFWDQAESLSLDIELYPTRFAPAVVETKAWLAVSTTHVYVAFNALDPNPQNIRSGFRERDDSKEDDYVSIVIDTTGTLAKKYEFRVNPHGTLSDLVQDSITERYNYDWDTRWEAAARIHDNGYTVEIAIPVGSIRTPVLNDEEDHKGIVILKRSYPRRVDRTLATFFSFKRQPGEDSKTPDISMEGEGERAGSQNSGAVKNAVLDKLTFRPHYIYHLDEKRPIGGDFSQVPEHSVHEAGIHIKYDFDTARTASLTINPNFTEVEADIARQSINNPFNVFQPEKRRFFRAATEYYHSLIPTVYTRNLIRPQWGLSYIRDDVRSSFGAFGVKDRETEVIMPDTFGSEKVTLLESNKSGAFRYRFSKDGRTIGLIGTVRISDDYHNGVVGVDGLFDLGIDDKFRYQLLYSDTEYPERFADDLCEEDDCTQAPPPVFCPLGNCPVNAQVLRTNFGQPLQGYGLNFRYKHDGVNSLYWVGYEEYSPEFRADLGFQRSTDIRTLNMAYGRKWYVDAFKGDGGKSRIRGYLVYTHTRSHEDNDQLESGVGLWVEFRGSFQSTLRLGRRYRERAVNRINQASLSTGSNAPLFDENYWQWYFQTSPWKSWTLHLDGRIGETADSDNLVLGDMQEVIPRIALRLGYLQLSASVTLRNFKVDNSRLYKERFFSLTAIYRKDHRSSHRLLYLDDLTKRDTQRWLGVELDREEERTLEYTYTYNFDSRFSVLAGVKAKFEYESDIDDDDVTRREVYLKVEKRF